MIFLLRVGLGIPSSSVHLSPHLQPRAVKHLLSPGTLSHLELCTQLPVICLPASGLAQFPGPFITLYFSQVLIF